ncbi:MAG: alpha/beta hydrolase [Chloroflexi bacterium]|nr:alpha/beta hydrolase [Chloroflexota bacterium]
MPRVQVGDVAIEYVEAGSGVPLVWCHELAGAMESWLPQVQFFARRYRVIAFNARGYPPSDVPEDPTAYSQELAVADLHGLLRALGIAEAYVGGLSMGGATALQFGLRHPAMARGLVVAGAGTGSTDPERFRRQCEEFARSIETAGMEAMREYTAGPTRVQLRRKDPLGWRRFADDFLAHSAVGTALTLRGVQGGRPPIFEYESALRALAVPTLIVVGDEDEPCLEPALFLKRTIPRAGLAVLPQSGHTLNLEEPDLFNRAVLDFLTAVESGAWAEREEGSGAGFLAGPAT